MIGITTYFTDAELFTLAKKIGDGTFKMDEFDAHEINKAKLIREKLSKFHTKQLLQLLHNTYISGDDEYPQLLLYEELAKRPHIPNKKEGKVIRQQSAKKYKGTRNKNK